VAFAETNFVFGADELKRRHHGESTMTDHVSPTELLQEAVQLAKKKSELSVTDMLIRGALSGAFLGYATSLAFLVTSQGLPPIVGAILFPVGFVVLALLGLELVTGEFYFASCGDAGGNGALHETAAQLGLGVSGQFAWQLVVRGAFLSGDH
jgi:formate transporter